jgi:hypothetical protein
LITSFRGGNNMAQYSASDFNPITEHGTLPTERGILGRWKKRQEMQPVTAGQRRVLLDRNGAVVSNGRQMTAGERYWGPAHSWFIVDVTRRNLSYTFPSVQISPEATADITLVCAIEVLAAEKVVEGRVTSAREAFEPSLRELVVTSVNASAATVNMAATTNPRDRLASARTAAEQDLRSKLAMKSLNAGDALSARIISVDLRFDSATTQRLSRLQDASTEASVRTLWRNELAPHLKNPTTRALEEIFANPGPEGISAVLRRLEESDQQEQLAILNVVDSMINQKMADTPDEAVRFYAQVSDAIHGKLGDARKELDGGPDDTWRPPEDDKWS